MVPEIASGVASSSQVIARMLAHAWPRPMPCSRYQRIATQHQRQHGLDREAGAGAGICGGWLLVGHHITLVSPGPSDRYTLERLSMLP